VNLSPGAGAAAPGAPTRPTPARPVSGPWTGGAGSSTPAALPTTAGGGFQFIDSSTWDFWWSFNRDAYIDLKLAVWGEGPRTGDGALWLGRGQKEGAALRLRPSDADLRNKVAPALLDTLRTESSDSIVTSCLVALGQMGEVALADGDTGVVPAIRAFLDDKNQKVAETAVVSLALLRDPVVLPDLVALLGDTKRGRKLCGRSSVPTRTRAFAALGMGLVGERSAITDVRRFAIYHLVDALENDDTSSDELGVACVTALGMVLAAEASGDAKEAADRPPSANRAAQIRYLASYLEDSRRPTRVRAHAARALARLVDPRVEDENKATVGRTLLDVLDENGSGKRELRYGCLLALGLVGDADADALDVSIRKALTGAANDGDQLAKNFALVSLAQVSARPGRDTSGASMRAAELELLRRFPRASSRVRSWLGLAIGLQGHGQPAGSGHPSEDARSALRMALEACRSPADVGAYALALGLLRDVEAEELLVEKLRYFQDDGARGDIALALGMTGSRAAVPVLRDMVRESFYRPQFLRQAVIGLALLGDKEILPELIETMRDSQSSSVKAAVASVMGYAGDARAVDPLIEMLRDRELVSRSRAFAAVALGHVADRDEVPWTLSVSRDLNYEAHSQVLNSADQCGLLNMR
jgi:HEAT repeat protein